MENTKILVIDDDDDIRGVVKDFLQEQGYTILTASTASTGIKKAVEDHPHLILLDVGLPDQNGYQVCEKIRTIPALQHTPIIMLTGHTSEKEELNGFKAGADDYVAKPFKPARLLARIQTAIGRNIRELDANPLTHLPGNMVILQEIQNRIAAKRPFSVLYFDLSNFKAFNDRYGFVRGDEAIKLTANILSRSFASVTTPHAFLGHVGGDDFVGIINGFDVQRLCEDIIRKFDALIPQIYDEEDRRRGAIQSLDRKGKTVELPIMGLAIAVVTNQQKFFKHPGEIALIAGDLKKWVKTKNGSAYIVDRRT